MMSQTRSLNEGFPLPLQSGWRYDDDGRDFANWLNTAATTASGRRVAELLEMIRRAAEIGRRPHLLRVRAGGKDVVSYDEKSARELDRLHGVIHRKLANYSFHVRLSWVLIPRTWIGNVYADGVKGETIYIPLLLPEVRKREKIQSETLGRRIGEPEAALIMCRLAHDRLLHRIRRCAKCGRWIYARVEHKRYCSKECQLAVYRKSDKWKAVRRNYMSRVRARERAISPPN